MLNPKPREGLFSLAKMCIRDRYETLGGFIVTSLQRIPQTGDLVETDSKRLRIIQMVGQRIAKVKLELIEKSEAEDLLQ